MESWIVFFVTSCCDKITCHEKKLIKKNCQMKSLTPFAMMYTCLQTTFIQNMFMHASIKD
jgi:hypothetical protein